MTDVTVTRPDGSHYVIVDPSVQSGAVITTLLDNTTPISIRRGEGDRWIVVEPKLKRSTCRRGHARTAANTRRDRRGYLACRVCERERDAIKRMKSKGAT